MIKKVSMALDLRSSELEYSFIKERISNVEKHFSEISLKLAAYLKKLSQVRDSGDDLAGSISSFAAKENLNLSLRKCLMQFTDILKAVQEYRDAQIQRTDVKVVLEFTNYKPICKIAKSELKASYDIRAKELSMKNQLEKTRGKNPTNWQKIAQAEKEACRVQDEATRTTLELSKNIDNFEQQKLQDVKHAFLEFIKIELVFHAKAIELYTAAYNSIKNINVEEDLKEFRSHFRSYATPLDPNNVPQAEDQTNVGINKGANSNSDANKTVDHFKMSNSGFKASLESKASLHVTSTPNTTPSKRVQGSQKLDTLNRPNHSELENGSTSFGSLLEA